MANGLCKRIHCIRRAVHHRRISLFNLHSFAIGIMKKRGPSTTAMITTLLAWLLCRLLYTDWYKLQACEFLGGLTLSVLFSAAESTENSCVQDCCLIVPDSASFWHFLSVFFTEDIHLVKNLFWYQINGIRWFSAVCWCVVESDWAIFCNAIK